MGNLNDFVNRNSLYITLKDGDSFTGIFKGAKTGANPFDPTKELVFYEFDLDGNPKIFKSGSLRIARALANVKAGQIVTLQRQGDGMKTKYEVKVTD